METARFSLCALAMYGCSAAADGYDPSSPTHYTCGCDGADACYEAAASLDGKGEKAETGEELLYLSQCACSQGSVGGCNTISHFAKDYVHACVRAKTFGTPARSPVSCTSTASVCRI
jgi:hypothetical protein